MIDLLTDTSTVDSWDLEMPPLGGSEVAGQASVWAEWFRLNTKTSFGSAILLYEEAVKHASEHLHSGPESTATLVYLNLERASDPTLTAVDLPTLCYYPWARPTGRRQFQLAREIARSFRHACESFSEADPLVSEQLVAYLAAFTASCVQTLGRSLVESAEVIAEDLTDLEYVGPQLEAIESRYSLGLRSEVLRFVWEHAYLQPLLVEAHQHIRECFPTAELVLDLLHDREVDGWEELAILIRTDLAVEEAGAALDRLDEAWWLDRLPDARGELSIDLQFT
jgi:hypothetical protein